MSCSIDDEEDRSPLVEWRALRPDQRGAVYDGLAQLVQIAATDGARRAAVIGACSDLTATYYDTGAALGCAARVLREVAASDEVRSLDAGRINPVVALLAAIDALPCGTRLDLASWLQANGSVVVDSWRIEATTPLRLALADLLDPEGE